MNGQTNQDYYAARAAMSRALAQRAAHPSAAAIHTELASRYESLAAESPRREDIIITPLQAT